MAHFQLSFILSRDYLAMPPNTMILPDIVHPEFPILHPLNTGDVLIGSHGLIKQLLNFLHFFSYFWVTDSCYLFCR